MTPTSFFGARDFRSMRGLVLVVLLAFAIVPVALVASSVAARALSPPAAVIDLEALAGDSTAGQEVLVSVAVSATTATAVAAGSDVTSWQCQAGAVQVRRVNQGATTTTTSIGPYCTACAAGDVITVPAQRVFLLAASPTTITCSRLAGGRHAAAGGGGALVDPACELAGGVDCQMSGQLRTSSTSSLASPSLARTGDTDSGVHWAASDDVYVVAGSLPGVEVTSSRVWLWQQTQPFPVAGSAGSPTMGGPSNPWERFYAIAQTGAEGSTGSSASPPFSFAGDPDTGVFRRSSNVLGLAAGGAPVVTVTGGAVTVQGNVSPEASTPVRDLGTTTARWGSLFAQDGMFGPPDGKPLTIQDADGLNIQTSSLVSIAGIGLQVPQYISTSPVLPTCLTAALAGAIIYADDTDDAAPGELCQCNSVGGAYAWRKVSAPSTVCV